MWLPSTLRLVAATALLLLPQTLAAPLEARAQMDEFSSGSATVQWSSAAGNNIRSYHIRDDCSVVEDSWGPGFSSWSASVLPFCGGSTAALSAVILTDPSGNPEVVSAHLDIQLPVMKLQLTYCEDSTILQRQRV